MQNLVVFSSSTGNTQKIANAIFSVLKGEKELINLNEIENVDTVIDNINSGNYNKLIIGYWVDKGDADEKMLSFMSKIKNKTISLFVTMGGNPTGEHAKKCIDKRKKALEENGNIIEKVFVCQGKIDPKLLDKYREMTRKGEIEGFHKATPEAEARWAKAAKHPDENDIKNAEEMFKG